MGTGVFFHPLVLGGIEGRLLQWTWRSTWQWISLSCPGPLLLPIALFLTFSFFCPPVFASWIFFMLVEEEADFLPGFRTWQNEGTWGHYTRWTLHKGYIGNVCLSNQTGRIYNPNLNTVAHWAVTASSRQNTHLRLMSLSWLSCKDAYESPRGTEMPLRTLWEEQIGGHIGFHGGFYAAFNGHVELFSNHRGSHRAEVFVFPKKHLLVSR